MKSSFKTVALIGKYKSPEIAEPLLTLARFLERHKVKVLIDPLTAVLRDDPREFNRSVEAPEEVRDIVMRCLRKAPGERFQSMEDVKDALEQIYFALR